MSITDGEFDAEFEQEMLDTFLIEFGELMDLYSGALREIRSFRGDNVQAFKDIFRVFHTLKGDAAYFPEFSEFAKYASHHCELLRNLEENKVNDQKLISMVSINYSRLSGAYKALTKGKSLKTMRFRLFLRNF